MAGWRRAFSDNKKLEVEDKKQLQAFNERPYYYDGQFDIASGQYTLKAAFNSGGSNFGKVEMPPEHRAVRHQAIRPGRAGHQQEFP